MNYEVVFKILYLTLGNINYFGNFFLPGM